MDGSSLCAYCKNKNENETILFRIVTISDWLEKLAWSDVPYYLRVYEVNMYEMCLCSVYAMHAFIRHKNDTNTHNTHIQEMLRAFFWMLRGPSTVRYPHSFSVIWKNAQEKIDFYLAVRFNWEFVFMCSGLLFDVIRVLRIGSHFLWIWFEYWAKWKNQTRHSHTQWLHIIFQFAEINWVNVFQMSNDGKRTTKIAHRNGCKMNVNRLFCMCLWRWYKFRM